MVEFQFIITVANQFRNVTRELARPFRALKYRVLWNGTVEWNSGMTTPIDRVL